jgi:hypothetical protein
MKRTLLFTMAAAFLLVFSVSASSQDSKAVQKAKEKVENAAPDDWETYAKGAEVLIRKNTNMKEASEWLDKSIEIKATSFNLELKGDYYMANNLPEKAMELYIMALKKGKEEDKNFRSLYLQEKIVAAQQAS